MCLSGCTGSFRFGLLSFSAAGGIFSFTFCAFGRKAFGLGLSLGYESLQEGLDSLRTLAALDFDIACFGHGKPIMSGASDKFRAKW